MQDQNQPTLHQRLKIQTHQLHKDAYQIPYVAQFLNDNIQLESYVGHLRSLAIIYGTIENQLSAIKHPEILDFLDNYIPKLPLILADLEYFSVKNVKDVMPAVSHALHVADKILMNIEKPYKLLGYIYTLDGSLNGGTILKKHVSIAFSLKDKEGVSYLSSVDDRFKSFWESFIFKLNTQNSVEKHKEDIISAANEIFCDIMKIYEALCPLDEKMLGNHITSLNPEAGNFPIPTDPREIKAAISAGIACWDTFPYFEKRFGERGRRFASSDAVWLVTLSELSGENALKQVNWLARFLAIRGMPTYMEEIQMRLLYSKLSELIPENKQKYLVFLKAADDLKVQRNASIDEADFENCNSGFESNLQEFEITDSNCLDLKLNIGKLIASSVADFKNGIPEARASLEGWLKNKEIFPENWILVVEKTYGEIENLVKI